MRRFRVGISFGIASVLALTSGLYVNEVWGCPFCSATGQTMMQAVEEADVAFIAELSDSKPITNATPGGPDGETKAHLLRVLKSNPAVEKKGDLVLPRYLPAAEKDKVRFLVYAIVADGVVDPYRATPVDSDDLADYLAGAVDHRKKPPADRIAYFFKYLDNKDQIISNDAYSEFALAPYKEVKSASSSFNPDTIIKWLDNPKTEPYRIGLYGLLLGICGRASDRAVLQAILEDPKRRPISGVDGLLGGLCVLDPKNGPEYVIKVLVNPENDFNYRYSALRTVKFLASDMPEVSKDQLFAKMQSAIQIPDISDLVIDEYRRNQIWTATDVILPLFDDPKFGVQVIKRAITRYALKCPDPKAEIFVKKLREKDPQFVSDVEEILRFEEAQQIKAKEPQKP